VINNLVLFLCVVLFFVGLSFTILVLVGLGLSLGWCWSVTTLGFLLLRQLMPENSRLEPKLYSKFVIFSPLPSSSGSCSVFEGQQLQLPWLQQLCLQLPSSSSFGEQWLKERI